MNISYKAPIFARKSKSKCNLYGISGQMGSNLQEETEMARRGENIHKRKDGRWEGRYIKARTPEGKIQWGYVYGAAYAEVKQVLIRKEYCCVRAGSSCKHHCNITCQQPHQREMDKLSWSAYFGYHGSTLYSVSLYAVFGKNSIWRYKFHFDCASERSICNGSMCANIDANRSFLPVPEWKIKKSNLLAFVSRLNKTWLSQYIIADSITVE